MAPNTDRTDPNSRSSFNAPTASANIAERLRSSAAAAADQDAIIIPGAALSREQRIRFRELDELVDQLACGLVSQGVQPGERLVLMVRPGIEFIALTFALFRAGAVAVLIDPGMGMGRMLSCLKEVEPHGFVAIPVVHAVRWLRRSSFPDAQRNVVVGRSWVPGSISYQKLQKLGAAATAPVPQLPAVASTDPAAIIFTSGGTGPPKGVLYEHGMFSAQVDLLRDRFGIQPGEIDLPAFPLFALFNLAMQVTTVVPRIDPTRPAKVDPRRILAPIRQYRITQAFGSPALWNRVGRYCEEQRLKIPHLKRVLSAGAPVPVPVLQRMQAALEEPGADIHTPYGATEALPVATISATEVLSETAYETARGAGTCVGTAFPNVDIRIIRRTSNPIATFADAEELPVGEIGEIIVRSPSVTREYFRRPDATALAKIADGESFWHRMGDMGYLDAQQRLWFCGRKAHVVDTSDGPMYSVPCEAIFNQHPHVFRSALVGLGDQGNTRPLIVVEPEKYHYPAGRPARERFAADLRQLALTNPLTSSIDLFLFHPGFPVDVRHNIKIDREAVTRWAAMNLAGTLDCPVPPEDADETGNPNEPGPFSELPLLPLGDPTRDSPAVPHSSSQEPPSP